MAEIVEELLTPEDVRKLKEKKAEDPIRMLRESGWKEVPYTSSAHLVNQWKNLGTDLCGVAMRLSGARRGGWIKPPSMKLYSTVEAFEKEFGYEA